MIFDNVEGMKVNKNQCRVLGKGQQLVEKTSENKNPPKSFHRKYLKTGLIYNGSKPSHLNSSDNDEISSPASQMNYKTPT